MKNLLIIIAAIMFYTNPADAQYSFDIRSISLGRTSAANSFNSGAMNQNPANIQFQKTNDDATLYLNLVTNLGISFNSDFASVDFYRKYFEKDKNGNDKTLTLQEKDEVMKKAADGYTEIDAGINLFSAVVNTGIGSVGVGLTERAGSNFLLDKEFLDIALYGYRNNHIYDFSELKMGAYWIRQLNLTYANTYEIRKTNKFIDAVAYGISVKPQFGMYYLGTGSNNLIIRTNDSEIARGSGKMNLLVSGTDKFKTVKSFIDPSGFGLGFDFGVNVHIKEVLGLKNLNIGFSITDIGSIKWKKNTYEYIYDGNFAVTDITSQGQLDSLRDRIKGTKTRAGEFTTVLPTTIRLGVMYKLFGGLNGDSALSPNDLEIANFSAELIQGLNNNFGSSTNPVLALGAELNILNFITPRAGITIGGRDKFTVGFGIGMDLGSLDLDIGTNNITGLMNLKTASRMSAGICLKIKI
ncbi:MAG: hypothetical protein JST15_04595 [Bacteroidetes bacterium]|nr:hypothetical protein [Bacteroidota bacterium]